jgi:hypothetical protein
VVYPQVVDGDSLQICFETKDFIAGLKTFGSDVCVFGGCLTTAANDVGLCFECFEDCCMNLKY